MELLFWFSGLYRGDIEMMENKLETTMYPEP